MTGNMEKINRPRLIVHVLGNLGPGGAEMGVIRLAEGLDNNEFSHRIVVFGADLSLQAATGTAVPCQCLGLEGANYRASLLLKKVLRKHNADLVHVNNLSPWFDAVVAARLAGIPCIETFHGVEQGRLKFPLHKKFLFRTAEKMSRAVTAVAAPAADFVATLTGINRNRIQVIPNGIDTDRFHPARNKSEKTALRTSFNLPGEALLLGCVAALRPVKNHQGLLHAFARVTEKYPSTCLVLVGEGILEKELRDKTRKLGIEEKVLFLGSRRDVPLLLRVFDIFVLNSETEGLSYSVLEAMASGLPVVATDVGANPELVTNGREGILVPEGDGVTLAVALESLVNKPDHLQTLGENARRRVVESFSFSKMIQSYSELYAKVLGIT